MTTATKVIHDFYALFETGDVQRINRVLAPQWRNHPADPGQPDTQEGFVAGIKDQRDALHGLTVTLQQVVEQTIGEDQFIVCRIHLEGTFVAPLAGIDATGRPAGFDAMDMHQVRDGLIVNTWHYEHLEQLQLP